MVDAPRLVSSDASPTRPECAVTRVSIPAVAAAAVNRNPIICADNGTPVVSTSSTIAMEVGTGGARLGRGRQRISNQIPRRFDQAAHWRSHGPAGVDRLVESDLQRVLQQGPGRVLAADVLAGGAGEGINLQRAHLMVNYDLPWNPNRLEQRFGRIHRIGQTEVCHLWNLVADETRESDVYRRLLEKLEQARQALGGQVFDVLGKLEFEGRPLRELLLDAIRYGEQPEVRACLDTAVDQALDRATLQDLLEERQLVRDAMDASRCSACARRWSGPRRAACSRTTSNRSSARRSGSSAARPANVNRAATRCRTFRP